MRWNFVARRHLILLIFALCGGAFGGAADLWLWSGVLSPEFEISVFAGIILGTLPGTTAGLVAMLIIEKRNLPVNCVVLPAAVSFVSACVVAPTVWLPAYFRLALAFAGG